MRLFGRWGLVAVALVGVAAPARGQGLGFDVFGGYASLTNAKKSAEAVFDGSSGGGTFGAGVHYTFKRGIYLAGDVRFFKKTGQRVFLADATSAVYPLGHQLTMKLVPVFVTVGYRFHPIRNVVPYVGLGGGITSYREESDVAGETISSDQSTASGHILGGVEISRRRLRLAVEVRYSTVPSTLGLGGVSAIYREKDAGGLALLAKIGFELRKK